MITLLAAAKPSNASPTHVGKEEEGKEVDEGIRQFFVLFQRVPDLKAASVRAFLAPIKSQTCFQPMVR